jgi:hypothetical protein
MKKFKPLLLLFMVLLLGSACQQVHIEVRNIPVNTPIGAQLYLTGNFNNWNPSDPNYMLKYDELKNVWGVDLPRGFGNVYYKFTRGDWRSVETDSCGGDILNRSYVMESEDTIFSYISGFKDLAPVYCGRLTLVLDEIPANTPLNSKLYLSGNINYWMLNEQLYEFTKLEDGKYYLTVPRREDKLIFKINRGTWESIEVDENNLGEESRQISFGEEDTVRIKMRAWMDLPISKVVSKTIVLKSLPKNTPANSKIYLSGNFCNWHPLDNNYLFKKNAKGYFEVKYTFTDSELEAFKITRGGWDKREIKANGAEISNRTLRKEGRDTIYLSIEEWADNIVKLEPIQVGSNRNQIKTPISMPNIPAVQIENPYAKQQDCLRKIFIILDKVPDMNGQLDKVYLTGDFNDWVTDMPGFEFKDLGNGKKYYILRLNDKREHEFKLTRGDWSKEEADRFRNKLNNKKIESGSENDTLHLRVENWIDYIPSRKLVVAITQLPSNTPPLSNFYLSGNFNGWQANIEAYKFKKNGDNYYLTIPQFNANFEEYKVTRGSWNTEFANKKGRVMSNKKFNKIGENDTLYIKIEGWVDIPSFN